MWYYILAFIIILILYSFYNQEIDYAKQKITQVRGSSYLGNLRDYYRYYMI